MKYWNVSDKELLYTLNSAGISDLDFAVGLEGGVSVYWHDYFLGVWVEFHRGLHDFVPAAHLMPTYSRCDQGKVVEVCRWLAAEASVHVPRAREMPRVA